MERNCAECDRVFKVRNSGAFTCSPVCGEARRKRNRDSYNALRKAKERAADDFRQCTECTGRARGRALLTCSAECSEVRAKRYSYEKYLERRSTPWPQKVPGSGRELGLGEIALPAGKSRRRLAAAFLNDVRVTEAFMDFADRNDAYFAGIDGMPLDV